MSHSFRSSELSQKPLVPNFADRRSFAAGVALCAIFCVNSVYAQRTYPDRPVHIVVPFVPGGGVDTVARSLGERLSNQLAQAFVIDNKGGGNGNIGTEAVAKAVPDGYTLLVAANGVVTNNLLYPRLSFNSLRDFSPVLRIGYAPLVLVTAISAPYKSVQDLVDAGRVKPDSLTYGSAGNGSSGHLAGALFASTGSFSALHVAYKGGSPALIDLIAGRISFMLLNPLEALPHIKSGRLRALAVSGAERVPSLLDVPTMPGFEAAAWWVLLAPSGTPAEIIAKLYAESLKALSNPAMRTRLSDLGLVIAPFTPEQTTTFLRSESDRWGRLIKASNIQAD